MSDWEKIKEYLKKQAYCGEVHKMIWEDHAFLTDAYGDRYKITSEDTLDHVKQVVAHIIKRNDKKSNLNARSLPWQLLG
jgi:hypothetical protein